MIKRKRLRCRWETRATLCVSWYLVNCCTNNAVADCVLNRGALSATVTLYSVTCIVFYTHRCIGSTITPRACNVPPLTGLRVTLMARLKAHLYRRDWTDVKWCRELRTTNVQLSSVPAMRTGLKVSCQCYKRNFHRPTLLTTSHITTPARRSTVADWHKFSAVKRLSRDFSTRQETRLLLTPFAFAYPLVWGDPIRISPRYIWHQKTRMLSDYYAALFAWSYVGYV